MFWKPKILIEADPADFVIKLSNSIKGFKSSNEWLEILRDKDDKKEEINK
jgi:hypothetical protein